MMIENNNGKIKVEIDPKQKLTPFGGLAWLRLLMDKFDVDSLLSQGYGIKTRVRQFTEADYFRSTLALLLTGGHAVSDISKLTSDPILRDIIDNPGGIPTDSALCKFFHEATNESVAKLSAANLHLSRDILSRIKKSGRSLGRTIYAFMDSSELEVWGKRFEGAGKNYNGDRALRLHTLFHDDFLVGLQFNDIHHSVSYGWEGLLDNLDEAAEMTESRIHFLLDSAYYSHKILQAIAARSWFFSVTCRYCPELEREASIIEEDYWTDDCSDFYYKPAGFADPQRVVVHRRPILDEQTNLFREYHYFFVMTNSGGRPKEIIETHRFRAGEENRLKELLSDLGLHHPRFQSLDANQFYYQVAAMAYNLIKAAKYFILDRTKYYFLSTGSFIYRFVLCAGRMVTHEWKRILKPAEYPLDLKFIEYRLAVIPPG
jgi:hypothetical protein